MQHLFTKAHVGSNSKTSLRARHHMSRSFPLHYSGIYDTLYFLDEMEEKYNLKTAKDWKSVTRKQIIANGGFLILEKYFI